MNHPDATGVGLMPKNTTDGVRMSMTLTHLNPNRHRLNLTIRANAQVRRVLFDGNRATGVEVESGGRTVHSRGGGDSAVRGRRSVALTCSCSPVSVRRAISGSWAYRWCTTCRGWAGTCVTTRA